MRLHVGLIKYSVTSFGYNACASWLLYAPLDDDKSRLPALAGRRSTALIHRWRPSAPRPHNIDPKPSAQSPTGGRRPHLKDPVIERAEWSNFRHLALILEYE